MINLLAHLTGKLESTTVTRQRMLPMGYAREIKLLDCQCEENIAKFAIAEKWQSLLTA
jgi:hypothetical protein